MEYFHGHKFTEVEKVISELFIYSFFFSREGVKIPLLVTTCVTEVERRGLRDLGIYRVSGLSSEIQRLKKAFEKSE